MCFAITGTVTTISFIHHSPSREFHALVLREDNYLDCTKTSELFLAKLDSLSVVILPVLSSKPLGLHFSLLSLFEALPHWLPFWSYSSTSSRCRSLELYLFYLYSLWAIVLLFTCTFSFSCTWLLSCFYFVILRWILRFFVHFVWAVQKFSFVFHISKEPIHSRQLVRKGVFNLA